MNPAPIRCRPFNLVDAMILIAGAAVGLALMRQMDQKAFASEDAGPAVLLWAFSTFPVGSMLTVAFLVARIRPPRPPIHRLIRGPGVVACCAVAVLGIVLLFPMCVQIVKRFFNVSNFPGNDFAGIMFGFVFPAVAGYVVLVTWGLLAVGGRGRRERGWLEWVGIGLGLYWILIALTATYLIV